MKRVIFITIVAISLFAMQSMVRSIYSLWQKHDLLLQRENELAKQKKEHGRLTETLLMVESVGFVEQEMRNKLFLQKKGENRVVVDERLLQAAIGLQSNIKKEVRPNWQQWWELFF